MTSHKNTSIFDFKYNSCAKVTISHKIINTNLKNMDVIQLRPTHIPYQCVKVDGDRALFNVIVDVCYV